MPLLWAVISFSIFIASMIAQQLALLDGVALLDEHLPHVALQGRGQRVGPPPEEDEARAPRLGAGRAPAAGPLERAAEPSRAPRRSPPASGGPTTRT